MRRLSLDLEAQPLFHSEAEARTAAVMRASRREKLCGSGVDGRLEACIFGLKPVYARLLSSTKATRLANLIVHYADPIDELLG